MNQNKNQEVYRQCVAALIYNPNNKKVLVFQRIDHPGSWQFPQGGVEGEETMDMALLREIEEETGIKHNKLSIILATPKALKYKIPTAKLPKSWGGKYCGQAVTFFLVGFSGSDNDINLNHGSRPEFNRFKWVPLANVLNEVVAFKREMYGQVLKQFMNIIGADEGSFSNILFSDNNS